MVKCWNHPDSEKLLCEEIDMGGGDVRTIASGIRAFYTAEEVQGRTVMVLCNLKERSIAGFKSQVCVVMSYIYISVCLYCGGSCGVIQCLVVAMFVPALVGL